jgi:hypothetical protein
MSLHEFHRELICPFIFLEEAGDLRAPGKGFCASEQQLTFQQELNLLPEN